ncbi:hypothetical protein J3A83DRAFT_4186377 [Scleroderma citrinum]
MVGARHCYQVQVIALGDANDDSEAGMDDMAKIIAEGCLVPASLDMLLETGLAIASSLNAMLLVLYDIVIVRLLLNIITRGGLAENDEPRRARKYVQCTSSEKVDGQDKPDIGWGTLTECGIIIGPIGRDGAGFHVPWMFLGTLHG